MKSRKRLAWLAIVALALMLGGCGGSHERAEAPQGDASREQEETVKGDVAREQEETVKGDVAREQEETVKGDASREQTGTVRGEDGASGEDAADVPSLSENGALDSLASDRGADAGRGNREAGADAADGERMDAGTGESETGKGNSAEEPAAGNDGMAGESMAEGAQSANSAAEGSGSQMAGSGGFSFADVEGWQFKFSSGSGGWHTVLDIYADGSFEGTYHDANMGETGEGYPNGTVRHSDFPGHFTSPERVDDATYVFQIADIRYAHEMGQEIDGEEGALYVYTDAYGLKDAENLYLYLPGSELARLPEQFLNWAGYANYGQEALERYRLPYYGLFNEATQEGFSSAPYKTEMSAKEQIWTRIGAAESQSQDAEHELYEI